MLHVKMSARKASRTTSAVADAIEDGVGAAIRAAKQDWIVNARAYGVHEQCNNSRTYVHTQADVVCSFLNGKHAVSTGLP